MRSYSKFIGLDVHKDSIAVGVADAERTGEVRFYGTIANNPGAVAKAIVKIAQGEKDLLIAYEAGPTGYGIHRQLTRLGFDCQVIAPSLIPVKAGDKIKTDRRDGLALARLLRAGELTPVHIPGEEQESLRDLCRARDDLRRMQTTARQRLKAFMLRHERVYAKTAWCAGHYAWIRDQNMGDTLQQLVLEEYLATVCELDDRLNRMTREIEKAGAASSFAPQIKAVQAMRGVSMLVATTVAAEIGDLTRFDHPKALMAFVGLVPSEHSSGNKVKRGAITGIAADAFKPRGTKPVGVWKTGVPEIGNGFGASVARLTSAAVGKLGALPSAGCVCARVDGADLMANGESAPRETAPAVCAAGTDFATPRSSKDSMPGSPSANSGGRDVARGSEVRIASDSIVRGNAAAAAFASRSGVDPGAVNGAATLSICGACRTSVPEIASPAAAPSPVDSWNADNSCDAGAAATRLASGRGLTSASLLAFSLGKPWTSRSAASDSFSLITETSSRIDTGRGAIAAAGLGCAAN